MKCRSGELSRENKWKDRLGYGYMINYRIGAFPEKENWAEMVNYFTGVYMTNKTLYDRLQIRNFYSCVQKSSFVRCIHTWHSKINFVSPHVHVISILYMYIFTVPDRQTFMAYKPPKKIAFQTEISGKKFSRIFFVLSSFCCEDQFS